MATHRWPTCTRRHAHCASPTALMTCTSPPSAARSCRGLQPWSAGPSSERSSRPGAILGRAPCRQRPPGAAEVCRPGAVVQAVSAVAALERSHVRLLGHLAAIGHQEWRGLPPSTVQAMSTEVALVRVSRQALRGEAAWQLHAVAAGVANHPQSMVLSEHRETWPVLGTRSPWHRRHLQTSSKVTLLIAVEP